ncbi:hypothetical protein [Actinoallomurus rhizosphaericola]|uniref:hypothetical protein n=1 Tax=Actinoallomurus rhizosphaericola TaxID=2952536 RepID=UPI002093B673|nr:hypothetical protein [Actinoallomurus rhizosphaericola]MCO5996600.1 hypothetical protein [Actinoallomurus rhizosphaericola]
MTSAWPEEPGYHWVTHNDSAASHLLKAENALARTPPDTAAAQVHATLAQAEATLVVVHTLRDIMAKMREQTMAIEDLRQFMGAGDRGDDRLVDDGVPLPRPGAVVDR